MLAAYRIAKTLSHTDQNIRTKIADTIDFYRGPSKGRESKQPE